MNRDATASLSLSLPHQDFTPLRAFTEVTVDRATASLDLHCGEHRMKLQAIAPRIFRIVAAPAARFEDSSSPAVVLRAVPPAHDELVERVELVEGPDRLELRTMQACLSVDKATLSVRLADETGRVLAEDVRPPGFAGPAFRCWKRLPSDARIYGLGEKMGPLDKRAQRVVHWNTDMNPLTPDVGTMYQSQPFFIGLSEGVAFGLYLDVTFRSYFDMGRTHADEYFFGADGGKLDYYLFVGPSVKDVVARYTELTGRPTLPPLWALGHQQSRCSYRNQAEVIRVAATFREKAIPCDALYLDLDYMDRFRIFEVDRTAFPDFSGMCETLQRDGFNVVPIVDCGLKEDETYRVYEAALEGGHLLRKPDGSVYFGCVWPGKTAWPDFSRSATRAFWGERQRELLQQGVGGIWNDMNEPSDLGKFQKPDFLPEFGLRIHRDEGPTLDLDVVFESDHGPRSHAELHNLYGYLMCQATYEGCLAVRPEERPFVLTRAGFSGIQRYAAVWTGDNHSWWDQLGAAMPMLLNMGLSGLAFSGCDIGGFGGECSAELLCRWYQLGVFLPLCRNHNALRDCDQEPWAHGLRHESIIRDFIRLRYRLLRYLYSVMREASVNGTPLIRPLLLEFQSDAATYGIGDEFLCGPHLLVAPVTQPGATQRMVYLPAGTWFDLFSGEAFAGKQYVVADAPLERIPVFARGGGILPLCPAMNYATERPVTDLALSVYPGGRGSFDYYEDDNRTFGYTRGEYNLTRFGYSENAAERTLSIEPLHRGHPSEHTSFHLKFHALEARPQRVLADGEELPFYSSDELERVERGAAYLEAERSLIAKIPANPAPRAVRAVFG